MADDSIYAAYNTLNREDQASQAVANALLAPPIVGWILHFLFYGAAASSCWEYVATPSFRTDSHRKKLMLASVMVLGAAAVAVNVAQMLKYGTIQERGIVTFFFAEPVDMLVYGFAGTLAYIVHLYLLFRASNLFVNNPRYAQAFKIVMCAFATIAWLMSLAATAFAVVYLYSVRGETDFGLDRALYIANVIIGTWLWCSAFVDLAISISLWMTLRQLVAGFSASTDNLLHRVMNLSVRTASFPAIVSIAGAILAVCFPPSSVLTVNLMFTFVYPLPALQTLAFLATLRSRESHSKQFQIERDREIFQISRLAEVVAPLAAIGTTRREAHKMDMVTM